MEVAGWNEEPNPDRPVVKLKLKTRMLLRPCQEVEVGARTWAAA